MNESPKARRTEEDSLGGDEEVELEEEDEAAPEEEGTKVGEAAETKPARKRHTSAEAEKIIKPQ